MSKTMYLIIAISFVKILEAVFITRYSQQSLGLFIPLLIIILCVSMVSYHRGVISRGAEKYIFAASKARQKTLRRRNKTNKIFWIYGHLLSLIIGLIMVWDIYMVYIFNFYFEIDLVKSLAINSEKTLVTTDWLIYVYLVVMQLVCTLGSRRESKF